MNNFNNNKSSLKLYLTCFCLFLFVIFLIMKCSNEDIKTSDQTETVSSLGNGNQIDEKTPWELEDESIKSGIVQDSTVMDFVFGMTKNQVIAHCKKLKGKNIIGNLADGSIYYAVETRNFKKIALGIKFYYDNENKLFRITEQPVMLDRIEKKEKSNSDALVVDELLTNYKRDLGNKPLTNGTQPDAKFYWLKGDKRFDFLVADTTCLLARTKISVERKMIAFNQEVEQKKQEEEILQKEKLANLQIQEEERIITKLKAKAKRDWPDNYSVQEYWINEQIEAYHYMLTIPNNDRIKKKAQRDWPLDFSVQKFWYREQIEAKERLE